MPTKQDYLNYISAAGEDMPGYLERSIASWRASFDPHNALFGYAACGGPAAAAAIDAFLYAQTGERRYAEQTRAALLRPRELAAIFPAEIAARHPEYHRAVPPMDGLFVPPNYIPAYEWVRDSGVLSPEDHAVIAAIVADSLHTLLHFPEWGAHNRAMLRALSLALAARAFPAHPEAAAWCDLAAQLAEDSWGRWSIEDAMGYHAVWWLALCTYAEVAERPDFYSLPVTHYYFHYFARMFTPLDTFPDFGDCNWGGGAERLLPSFEKAAAAYGEPAFKYIAERMFQHMVASGPPSVGNALLCIQAYAWADDTVPAIQPAWESREILDDLVGKKILFRGGSGASADDTYLLLNYRDEMGYGAIPRRYLRTTLAVSAEKMHHGHADENAIVLLLDRGAALLHEGGYRDNVPNGRYRADIYHNRVIWRPGIKRADASAWDFLHDDGSYKITRTQKLHFARFRDVEFSRTQVVDDERGVAWDRIVAYLKPLGCFALIDAVRALKSGPFTLANILYTTDVLATGDAASGGHYFDTAIRAIGPWQNPQHRALLIAYPLSKDRPVLVEETRRHYQQETGLYQIWTGHLTQGDIVPFVTVLWPHERDAGPATLSPLVEALSLPDVSHPGRSLALRITTTTREITFGCKLDLNLGLLAEETRPRYSFEAGRVRYGDFETDATHFYADVTGGNVHIGFTEATRLTYGQRTLYDGQPHRMFQEDGTNSSITPTWRERYETDSSAPAAIPGCPIIKEVRDRPYRKLEAKPCV